MEKTIAVEFEIGQKVSVKKHGVVGYINQIWVSTDKSIKYDVEYKSESGSINSRWFDGFEIEEA